jgi:hypothetical protein
MVYVIFYKNEEECRVEKIKKINIAKAWATID